MSYLYYLKREGWGWLALCCLLLAVWSCGGRAGEEEDELGIALQEDPDRYELVLVKAPGIDSVATDTMELRQEDRGREQAAAGTLPEESPAAPPTAAGKLPAGMTIPPGKSPAGTLATPPGKSPAGTTTPPGKLPAGTTTPPGKLPAGTTTPPGKLPAGTLAVTPGKPVVFDPQGDFAVQVGLYQDAKVAAQVVRDLTAEGYPAYTITSRGGQGIRVRIGYFKTREDAQRFGEIFKADRGTDFWVDRRASER